MDFINSAWQKELEPYAEDFFGKKKDKRIEHWKELLAKLPTMRNKEIELTDGVIIFGDADPKELQSIRSSLLKFLPWRKGPFQINNIVVDSEWKSNLKWDRFLELNVDLSKKIILDVGSGNGYSGFRMLGCGAKEVLCLEPNLMHVSQFAAINHFIDSSKIKMLPVRLEEVKINEPAFDLVFSMGLLYHQRNPAGHLELLASHLKEEGNIVLETIIAPEEYRDALIPEGRYANMPNVHYVHTESGLNDLLDKIGLEVVSQSEQVLTTLFEQRSTEWMPFGSLGSAVKEDNIKLTVEGLPAPKRQFFLLKNQNNLL